MKPRFKDVAGGSGFVIAWALLVAVVIAGGIAIVELPLFLGLIEAGILVVVLVLVFVAFYKATAKDIGTSMERSELKSILGSIEDALVVYGTDFRITFFNHAAEKLFKLSADVAIGHVLSPRDVENAEWRTLAQVIFPSLAPRVVSRTNENETPHVADVSLIDPELELRVATAPVIGENGATLAFMKIIRDHTAQLAALRSKNEFITVASHQLRGPVTDINWALQSLAEASELGETSKMIVTTAAQASKNLLGRIEDILSIAKMEDGQVGYTFENTDLVEYVGKILSDVLPAARKAGIKMYLDRPSVEMPKVMVDTKRLSLAVTNILENAIRYNVENGEVTVKIDLMKDKPYVVVSVKDTGIGIPQEALDKLFTKFYRAENAVKAQTEGSGLGLYIAKGIITAHGGQIWAESELGRGTTISFALPTDPNLVPKHEVGAADLL
jgi:signal transduction histidine kinase